MAREEVPRRSFELRGLSVRFPEGKLTVVAGPTASGKTALLVRASRRALCLTLISTYSSRFSAR
jgi:ABC-type cobalamin/Fe3+-siderophores transport system ATPase subunit